MFSIVGNLDPSYCFGCCCFLIRLTIRKSYGRKIENTLSKAKWVTVAEN